MNVKQMMNRKIGAAVDVVFTRTFRLMGIVGSLTAFGANNIICEVPVTGELIKVYSVLDESEEAKAPSVMVLSQPSYEDGNKTIAVLRRTSLAQNDSQVTFTGKVDHRDNESSREGELFAQTKIKHLKKVSISLNQLSLAEALAEQYELEGTLILDKRNGEVESMSVDCEAL